MTGKGSGPRPSELTTKELDKLRKVIRKSRLHRQAGAAPEGVRRMAQHDLKTGRPDAELAHELFGLVERHQGYAFISDGIVVLSRSEIFGVARASLKNTRIVERRLTKFLKKYAEQ